MVFHRPVFSLRKATARPFTRTFPAQLRYRWGSRVGGRYRVTRPLHRSSARVWFHRKDFVVRISDREFWTDFLREKDVPPDRWDDVLQVIDKFGRESREKTIEKLGELADPVLKVLSEGGKSEKLDRLVDGLRGRGLGEFVTIDVRIVRGLAYYTGIVFEVFDRAGSLRAVAGGGRYDNLIQQLSDGAVSMPALGFAM